MKKEINILRLIFLGTVIFIVFASIFVIFHFNSRVDYNQLSEVRISNSNAFASMNNRYTLTHTNGEWVAARKAWGMDDSCTMVANDVFVTNVKEILAEYNVHRWDGFDTNLTHIYDLSSIDFYMRFSDGKEVKASGYGAYPKNFHTVFKEIENLFDDLFRE